ncbi:GbsR/MarR family transcriptional regulator [Poriferisphaera sp. WC338]|uniref:GbsR/MarR family transcriptional regulator n=1 Tax=Poriferisphaera sp. WC338 TaxID=3425129 RepID=UPI003D813E5F
MTTQTDHTRQAKEHFIQGMSRIAQFWGFPRAMGAAYGVVYLSSEPVSLNQLVEETGVTKGAISTHVRTLDRLGLFHKHLILGDRRDYYIAETDFWKILRNVLREREKTEFDSALKAVSESREMLKSQSKSNKEEFYDQRMQNMEEFFSLLDKWVATITTLDSLQQSTLGKVTKLFQSNKQ